MLDLRFSGSSSQLRAQLARPIGAEAWPGVVVIQDSLGLNDDIREQADRIAATGYLALAPDLYSGRGCAVLGEPGPRAVIYTDWERGMTAPPTGRTPEIPREQDWRRGSVDAPIRCTTDRHTKGYRCPSQDRVGGVSSANVSFTIVG